MRQLQGNHTGRALWERDRSRMAKRFSILVASVTLSAVGMAVPPLAGSGAPPVVTAFSPASGPVGALVTLSGSGLSGLSSGGSVAFGGVASVDVRVDSDGQAEARVPANALSGAITVTTAGGVATTAPFTVTLSHLVVIEMENKALSSIVGNPSAPYLNDCLINSDKSLCPDPSTAFPTATYTQMFAGEHHSLPDYLDLFSGNNPWAEGTPCSSYGTSCVTPDRNIIDQLEQAHLTWAAYAQDYPGPDGTCNLKYRVKRLGTTQPAYTAGHVPVLYFGDIRHDPTRCAHVFGNPSGLTQSGGTIGGDAGLSRLTQDLQSKTLPNFSYITPNMFTDMHQGCQGTPCPPGAPDKIRMGDTFLSYWVPTILKALGPEDRLVVTWDEGLTNDNSGCCMPIAGPPVIAGGNIPTIVVGGTVTQATIVTQMDVFSLLTGIEKLFSLPGNIVNPIGDQRYQLNQPYATCGCTPWMQLSAFSPA